MINIGENIGGLFISLCHRVQKISHIFRVFRISRMRPAFLIFGLAFFICVNFVLSENAQANCVTSICYEYDALGRLSKAIMPGGGPGGADQTIEYTYDAAGNRTSRTISGGGALPPTIVVNSAGVVQTPFSVTTTTVPYPVFLTYTFLYDGSGTLIYMAISPAYICSGGTFYFPEYSFSGNGCEIIYQP